MRRFQIILLLLVGMPLAALTFASVRVFNAEVENLHMQKRAAVLRDIEQLTRQLRGHGRDVGKGAVGIVREAYVKGIWPLRCLYLEPHCAVDPDDLVRFGAVFSSQGKRLYPAEKALEQTITEKRIWARYAPQLNDIVTELVTGQGIEKPTETRADDGGSVQTGLVKALDGPALCAFASPLFERDEDQTVYCAVLDSQAFQKAVIKAQNQGGWNSGGKAAHYELIGADEGVIWSSLASPIRGEELHVEDLKWPFNGLKISGSWSSGTAAYFKLPVIGLATILFPGSFVLIALAVFLYRQRTVELGAARRQVERAALVSHELRTPLTNIRIYLEMIRGNEGNAQGDKAQLEANCKTIISEIERLDSLIERTLYSVQNLGQEASSNSQIKPDDVISTICARFSPLIEADAAKVLLDLDAASLVNIDRWDFEQVLINLLDNARRHAPGSYISVSSHIDDGFLLVEVVDRKKTTHRSEHNGDDFKVLDVGGNDGFGLGICRDIVQAYGGALIAHQQCGGRRYSASFRIDRPVGEGGTHQ